MKLKPLLPSLREKKRYIVFEIVSKTPIKSLNDISEAIQTSYMSFLGTKGAAKAGIMILKDKFNTSRQSGIIKVNHKYVDDLKASLALVKKIKNQNVILKSKGVSGVLKKTERFMEG